MTEINQIAVTRAVGAVAHDANFHGQESDDTDFNADAAALGIASGTSFPGSPATGDRFYRSDRNIGYFYDGTRWLSLQLFTINPGTSTANSSFSGTFNQYAANPHNGDYSIYVEKLFCSYYFISGTTASNYFTLGGQAQFPGSATVFPNISLQGVTAAQYGNASTAVNAVYGSTLAVLKFDFTETGTAQAILAAGLTYRLVG